MRPPAAPPDFSRLARVYRWMETLSFGPCLMRCRTTFLAETAPCRNALVLGDGDGRFTARLLAANPRLSAQAVDASPAMLAALRRAAGSHANRVRTQAADLRSWQPPPAARYDLVATHFFLDCLTTAEATTLARRLRPALAPGALWLVSEFAVPPGIFGRLVAAPLVAALYRAFALLTGLRVRHLPDHHAALIAAGFTLQQSRRRLHGLLASEVWSGPPLPGGCPAASAPDHLLAP